MKTLFLFVSVFSFWFSGHAFEKKYPVSAIPLELLKSANVVKRMEVIEFRVVSTEETILYHRYALTILNENGEAYAGLDEDYDKLRQVRIIEGVMYDANGEQMKKLKPKEIMDLSGVDNNNLMDDSRRKVHQFYNKAYPYTIEYETETRYNNTLFFPSWFPQQGEKFSVENSSYTLICPENYQVRFRAFNYKGEIEKKTEKGKQILKWQLNNLPAYATPFASPSWRELTTIVYFAPSDFEIQGYKGNMSNWKEFGKFVYSLKKDREKLPESILQKVKDLTAGVQDEKEKIRILYQYLQQQTRYISIQLGLGGWQPFEASFVAQKGYGDCKALTNYMYSLLKAAGIRSNYTLVTAGKYAQKILDDFPSQQFNHVILSVPLKNDTVWLECTSQIEPAGYLSYFTANRLALVVDEEGGTLVSTPRYFLQDNQQLRKITAKLEADGNLNMKVDTKYEALKQDEKFVMIKTLSKDKVLNNLQRDFDLSTYHVNDFSYEENKSTLPSLIEKLDITVTSYATVSGKRIFILPNIFNRSEVKLDSTVKRKVDIVFGTEYKDEDHYEIEIPDGYEVESPFTDVIVKTKFGNYSASVKIVGNKIIYHRIWEHFSGRFPATDLTELVRFYDKTFKADWSKMVLVKKGN